MTAHFSNIRQRLQSNIENSKDNICIAVAWFTSQDLFGQLIEKIDKGCNIEIIISDHIENKRLSFDKLILKGAKVYILPTQSGKFLHDKFAIFDNSKVVAGSYNWTYSAEFYNHEFIVQSDDATLLKQFSGRFKYLKTIVQQYDKLRLLSNDNLTAETKEEEFIKVEKELHDELIEGIDLSIKAGAKVHKDTILNQIYAYGAIGAANRLVKEGTEKLHSGLLKLYHINRLDLSIEHIIQKEKYKFLFSEDILKKAKERLEKLK